MTQYRITSAQANIRNEPDVQAGVVAVMRAGAILHVDDSRKTVHWNRIAEHIEHLGYTRCPGSGVQPYIAADRAASLTADYRLPSEGLYE